MEQKGGKLFVLTHPTVYCDCERRRSFCAWAPSFLLDQKLKPGRKQQKLNHNKTLKNL
jgi:hypothetical protein